ncbi:MAG: penicillin-insensitive murein endopeptidase [Nannocystaceae bacterium]
MTLALTLVGLTFVSRSAAAEAPREAVHVVAAGETLGKIARQRGCSVAELQRRNGLGRSTVILRGQRLDVACGAAAKDTPVPKDSKDGKAEASPAAEARHRVAKGESLSRIAARYGCSLVELRARNGIKGSTIHPGMELWIPASASRRPGVAKPSAPVIKGQSVGKPHRGKLVKGTQLPTDRAYYIRRKARAWGADHVIHYTLAAINAVRRLYPKLHRLAIGDLSHEAGGALSGHRSHQSGRDVDLGLFYRARPSAYPKEFAPGSARNLHVAATWALVEAILATQKLPGGVEHIFLDYELQALLYKYAREHGVARTTLGDLFQYPHGKSKGGTLIQHVPAHHDHLHVRFRCPPADSKCE